ncbi:MAG: capsular polysaccharide biosynthesis protein, partial [Mailhella sp.]|nr:capsular polysaccharide biosynthesis protein [Mailhella sp.]
MPKMNQPIPTATEQKFAGFSQKVCSIPFLETFLGGSICYRPSVPVSGVIGCVRDPAEREAKEYARKHGIPYITLEGGFLRSLSPGTDSGAFSLSLIADKKGIYYDAGAPSDLEDLLNNRGWESPDLLDSARKAMDLILAHGLSTFNHAPDAGPGMLGDGSKRRLLVIDQPPGDLSVSCGMADGQSFLRMLEDAASRRNVSVTVAASPEILQGNTPGHLARTAEKLGIRYLSRMVSPLSLLKQADEVYCVSSQMGFEALLLGKPVHCYGMPFYAGWGATDDILSCPRRKARRTVLEIFTAAYMLYSRYIDPIENTRCGILGVIARLALQKEKNEANRGYHACWGYPKWKQPYARAFLQGTESTFAFHTRFAGSKSVAENAARHGGNVVAWSSKVRDGALPAQCRNAGVDLIRMEDGFIRSVGLG